MNCAQTEGRLQELLDCRDPLDADHQLNQHLAACPRCATLASAYHGIAELQDCTHSAGPSEGLAARVLAEVNRPLVAVGQRPQPGIAARAWPAAMLAASVLVVVALIRDEASPPAAPTQQIAAAENTTHAGASPSPEQLASALRTLRGRQMIYRTGVDLASIYLVGTRLPAAITISEPAITGSLLPAAVDDTLRRIWPMLKDATQPTTHESRLGESLAHLGIV